MLQLSRFRSRFRGWLNLAKMTQIMITDTKTGEVMVDKTFVGERSKGGWIMVFQEAGQNLVAAAPSPAVLKVFMYLALGQTFNGGMVTTKAHVQRELKLSKPTVLNAFKWLESNLIVHEWRHNGCSEFMVSPVYVSVGNFHDRMKIWNERWDFKPMYVKTSYLRKKQQQSVSAGQSSAS